MAKNRSAKYHPRFSCKLTCAREHDPSSLCWCREIVLHAERRPTRGIRYAYPSIWPHAFGVELFWQSHRAKSEFKTRLPSHPLERGDSSNVCWKEKAIHSPRPAWVCHPLRYHTVSFIYCSEWIQPHLLCRYMGVCIAHAELGLPFPAHMRRFVSSSRVNSTLLTYTILLAMGPTWRIYACGLLNEESLWFCTKIKILWR